MSNSIILADSNSVIWVVGITDFGLLTAEPGSGTPVSILLNDQLGNSWQVPISTSGYLEVPVSVIQNPSYPTSILLESFTYLWSLFIIDSPTGPLLETSNMGALSSLRSIASDDGVDGFMGTTVVGW